LGGKFQRKIDSKSFFKTLCLYADIDVDLAERVKVVQLDHSYAMSGKRMPIKRMSGKGGSFFAQNRLKLEIHGGVGMMSPVSDF
jgi:hypothetical protein